MAARADVVSELVLRMQPGHQAAELLARARQMRPDRGRRKPHPRRDLVAVQPAELVEQEAVAPSRTELIDQPVHQHLALPAVESLVRLAGRRDDLVEHDVATPQEDVAIPRSPSVSAHRELCDAMQPATDVAAAESSELALHDDEDLLREVIRIDRRPAERADPPMYRPRPRLIQCGEIMSVAWLGGA